MKYLLGKSFATYPIGSKQYRDNYDKTFGKKPVRKRTGRNVAPCKEQEKDCVCSERDDSMGCCSDDLCWRRMPIDVD